MNRKRKLLAWFGAVALASLVVAPLASAQEVTAQLSTRESYVGSPIVLQLLIRNADDYQIPQIPEIDGCQIRSVGAPSQQSQITIINGRRSESRSVALRYLVTPRREGTFEIPPIAVDVDGRQLETKSLRFGATRSETGDLLFVEIEGGKEKVYVGQPLDLKLKIWVKPYRDRKANITLSEGQVWQLISENTSWGSFSERIQELADNRQRPRGEEVIRDDGQGNQRSYYLYEIQATVYPKRPGKIQADDVQIVINYPTAIGKARDPFAEFFEDSPFRSRLGMSGMMDDDFFASPFGNRLAVTESRPISAEAKVDSTTVVPVPTEGRPADYRGAVGTYQIATQAGATTVQAGDPIEFHIGIAGSGPMELVQAPPLSELPSLTGDFKVSDQPLAGFVQDNTKVFPATIRPRRAGITQIPAIPFSYFDPHTERFETVMSDPISITVAPAEMLSLDAIVGNSSRGADDGQDESAVASLGAPDFTNHDDLGTLSTQLPGHGVQTWWALIYLPPLVWLVTIIVCSRDWLFARLADIRSSRARCFNAIRKANHPDRLVAAIVAFVARRTRQPESTSHSVVGALRVAGLPQVAIGLESFFQRCQRFEFQTVDLTGGFAELQSEAAGWVERIDNALGGLKKSQVRRSRKMQRRISKRNTDLPGSVARRVSSWMWIVLIPLAALTKPVVIQASMTGGSEMEGQPAQVALTPDQQKTVFQEANEIYSRAVDLAQSDAAESNQLFSTAADKYQLLTDSGIHNSKLFINLGNSYFRSNRLGRAIASYESARQLDPTNAQVLKNLAFANSLVRTPPDEAAAVDSFETNSLHGWWEQARRVNEKFVDAIGMRIVIGLMIAASLLFWGVLTVRAFGFKIPTWRLAGLPLLVLVLATGSYLLVSQNQDRGTIAILVADEVPLYAGDGEQFSEVHSVDEAQGQSVKVLAERGAWSQIRTPDGFQGWVHRSDMVQL